MPGTICMHELDPALSPEAVLAQSEPAVRDLVIANHHLFNGAWASFAEDVRRRRAGRPYLFKVELKLDEDLLVWIHRLEAYEQARGATLASALNGEETR
jgi:hypothetical protein